MGRYAGFLGESTGRSQPAPPPYQEPTGATGFKGNASPHPHPTPPLSLPSAWLTYMASLLQILEDLVGDVVGGASAQEPPLSYSMDSPCSQRPEADLDGTDGLP